MNKIFAVFIIFYSCSAFAQADSSGYFFSKDEIISTANGIKKLQVKDSVCDALIPLYQSQLKEQQSLINTKNIIMGLDSTQLFLAGKNETLNKQIIKQQSEEIAGSKIFYKSWWFSALIGLAVGIYIDRKF